MAKKASSDEKNYVNIGKNPDTLLVQKSNPLTSLSNTNLSLHEFKILDAYLARINSHDEKKRTVVFEKGELEKLLEVDRIRKDSLDRRLRQLFQTVEVKDVRQPKGFKLINLFEMAEAIQDENGIWQISLTCSESAKEYIFNIENIGYLRYRLKSVINFKSRYSYVLFLYLVDNQYKKEWEIDINELRERLKCDTERNQEYKFLNSEVLKKCQKEITECTELRYDYKPIRKNRKVAAVRFTIISIADEIESEGKKISVLPILDIKEGQSEIAYFSQACEKRFSDEEMLELIEMVKKVVPDEKGSSEQYRFLALQYKTLVVADKRHSIKHPFNYLKKLVADKVRDVNKEKALEATTEFLSEACDNEFTPKQMYEILLMLNEKEFDGDNRYAKDVEKYDYLNKMYAKMDATTEKSGDEGNPIKNRFAYFKKMIANDIHGESLNEGVVQMSFDDMDDIQMMKYKNFGNEDE